MQSHPLKSALILSKVEGAFANSSGCALTAFAIAMLHASGARVSLLVVLDAGLAPPLVLCTIPQRHLNRRHQTSIV